MHIALCGAEGNALLALQTMVRNFCEKEGLDAAIDSFSSGKELLASVQPYDIVFIDVYLPDMDGMEAAKRAGASPRQQVVFTSASREHAVEAFRLNAAHYLTKPLSPRSVEEAMERCLTRLGRPPRKSLAIKTNQGTLPVPMEQIVFIEVLNKLCTIHTVKTEFRTYTSLDALFEQLNGSFLRVQRSYVINMKYVESFLFDRVILRGGMEITLSRSNRTELKRQYQRFLFDSAERDEA